MFTKLLTEHCLPERLYLETKWASLVSFDLAAQLFEDVLPIETHIHTTSLHNKGAHLLLQMRSRVLNGELEQMFRNWYPGFRAANEEKIKKVA